MEKNLGWVGGATKSHATSECLRITTGFDKHKRSGVSHMGGWAILAQDPEQFRILTCEKFSHPPCPLSGMGGGSRI